MVTQTPTALVTADDLLELSGNGFHGELIRGVLCETMAPGIDHAQIVAEFSRELGNFVKPRRLGRVVAGDPGVKVERDPDTVRAPDVAFISARQMPLEQRNRKYSEQIPELAVEVKSPSDSRQQVNDKAEMWLRHGVRLVWVAFPDERMVESHHAERGVVLYREDDELDGMDVLPGFRCAVGPLFEA